MRKILNILFLFICFTIIVDAQTDSKAKAIIDKLSNQFKGQTVKIDFKLTVEDTKLDENNKDVILGNLVMNGNMFRLEVPKVKTYYDGKDQYVFVLANKEVSVTTPSVNELQDINPAYMLKFAQQSTVQFSLDNKKNLSYHIIDVFPDRQLKKTYYKSIIKVDKKTNKLISIKVLSQNGIHTLFEVRNFDNKMKVGKNFFIFDTKANPSVIINDLR